MTPLGPRASRPHATSWSRAILALTLLACALPAVAQTDLYACRVIVTGTDERTRPAGLRHCLHDVIQKSTGKAILENSTLLDDPAPLIEDVVYLDRMTGIPLHDEQGTRDRPYDLIAHVDPARLAARLATAGLRIWQNRPVLAARISITHGAERYPLMADTFQGERHRQALLAAAELTGLRVTLPAEHMPGRGDDVLTGALEWRPAEFGWTARWDLGQEHWSVTGVSFDEAYRAGLRGAAAHLSH